MIDETYLSIKDAIEELKAMREHIVGYMSVVGTTAYDMGIEALEAQPKKGKWIEVDVRNCHATLKCSVCDRVITPTFTFGEYSYEDIKTFYPYCHCGAEMSGGGEYD